MIQTITQSMFIDAFRTYGRDDQFGYEALAALYDYLEECAPDTELDVIAICCDYSYDTYQDIAASYIIDIDGMNEDEAMDCVEEYLNDNTSIVARHANGFTYCSAF